MIPKVLRLALYLLILQTALSAAAQTALKPEIVPQTGHSYAVNSVCFSPDGKMLASGSTDGTSKLWDAKSGKEIRTLPGDILVYSVCFSPDGKTLASGGSDKTINLWDVESGKEIRTLLGSSTNSICFSPDGKMLASGGVDRMIRLRHVEGGKQVWAEAGHSDQVNSVCFSPDGKLLASGSRDKTIKLWDVESGKDIRTLSGHADQVNSVCFSPDGKILASGSDDKAIKLWDVESGECLRTLSGHTGRVSTICFSPDGKMIASGGLDSTIKLWNVESGEDIRTLSGHTAWVYSVCFSPDGKTLASGSDDMTIKLWEVESGNQVWDASDRTAMLNSVCFSPDRRILASGSLDCTIRLWDVVSGKQPRTLSGHASYIQSVCFSPDGSILASGSWDETVKLWDMESETEIRSLSVGAWVRSVCFSPDGKILASGDVDDRIKLWDVESGDQVWAVADHADQVSSVCFSPDGKMLASGSWDKTIKLWDVGSGECIRTLSGHTDQVNSVCFSPDGKMLASGSRDKTIKLWDVESGRESRTLSGHRYSIQSICFSPDGKMLASGSDDKAIKLWNVESGECIRTLSGHTDQVKSVYFSANGKMLASGSWDGTSRLWQVGSGHEIATIVGLDQTEYLITIPSGYYTCSKGGYKSVAFRIGNRAYPFEQFDLKFNRPDKVLEALECPDKALIESYRRAYQKRLRKMGFTESMLGDDFHVPEVALSTPNLPITTKEKSLSFKVKASDTKYKLDRLNVYVNDVPVYGIKGIDLRGRKVNQCDQEINLDLSAGRNKIQVSVLNEKGAESLKETIEIGCEAPAAKPDLYAVLIGVSRYADARHDLHYAAKDAQDLAAMVESRKADYGQVKVIRLVDEQADGASILALKNTMKQSKVDDTVVVFLSGHGILDKNYDYYFAPHDMDFADPAKKGVSYEAIEDLLDGIPARKKLLMMDACHSGELDKDELLASTSGIGRPVTLASAGGSATKGGVVKVFARAEAEEIGSGLGLSQQNDMMRELFADLRRGSGAAVISAAGGAEYALESPQWNNGVFTYSLLEGIKSKQADTNNDGQVTVSELRDYVTNRVHELTNGRQTPNARRENIDFDFGIF